MTKLENGKKTKYINIELFLLSSSGPSLWCEGEVVEKGTYNQNRNGITVTGC